MGFFKRIDDKFKKYLESKIANLDRKIELQKELEIQANMSNEVEVDFKNLYKNKSVGMYFMDIEKEIKLKLRSKPEKNDELLDFCYTLGCASQGRIREVIGYFEDIEKTDKLNEFLIYKPRVMRMVKASQKITESQMSDMKINESIGDYENRKLLQSKTFMKEFHFFFNLKLEEKI